MKKIIAFLLAGMLALALFACGGDTPAPTVITPTQPTTQGNSGPVSMSTDLYFSPKGVKLEIGAAPAPALEALKAAIGEPSKTFESESCALKAKDINYMYQGFVLTVTYPEQGEDYICNIDLDTDDYATPGGIRIKSTAEDVFAVYGTDYREDNGHYYYSEGMSILHIAIKDGRVSLLAYEYDWDNA